MILKWESKNARIAIAVLSIIFSIAVIVFVEGLPQQLKQDQHVINHICLLQIIGSVLLFIGSIQHNHWFFLPWLLFASIFIYALIYKSLNYWLHIAENLRTSLLIISVLYVIAASWSYFVQAVLQDFREIQLGSNSLVYTFI